MSAPSTAPPTSDGETDGFYRLSKRELLTLISAIMALMAMAIDLMLPAFDDIRETFDLGEGSNEVGQVITVFFFGLAFAQLIYGPLADRFGRKPVLYAGIGIYILGAIGSALAPTFELLLVSRFVWGIGAAGSRVVSTAIIRDRFEGIAMAKAMSQIMAVFVLVPVIAPSLGAVIVALVPWRGVFWFCVVWATAIGLWSLRLRETLNPDHRRPLSLASTTRGYVQVARTPVTFGYTVSTIFLQGVFTTYLASSELIISDIFDRGGQFPVVFGAVAIMFGLSALLNGVAVERVGIDRVVTAAFVAQLTIAAFLVALSLQADGVPSFWIFIPALGLLLSSFMFLIPNLNAVAMEPVGELAGSASALTGAARMAGGAVLGTYISGQLVDTVTPFAVGVAAMCVLSAVCVVLVRVRAAR